jgi:hypothetical protein
MHLVPPRGRKVLSFITEISEEECLWREKGRGGAAAVQHGLPSYRDDWVVQQTRLGGTGLSLTSPTHCSSVEKQNKLHNKK